MPVCFGMRGRGEYTHYARKEEERMKTPLSFGKLWAQIKKLFWLWLLVAVVAGVVILVLNYRNNKELNTVTATVNFSFDGIDAGLDPDGNRFDVDEIHSGAVVAKAAESIGLSLDADQLARVQSLITAEGVLPKNVISQITSYTSVYTGKEVSTLSSARAKSYFPTQYIVRFDYKAAGLSREQGAKLLSAVLDEYRVAFYAKYGYKTAMEQAILSYDFSEYDFEDAVAVLDDQLVVLRDYVASLISADKAAFRSAETGFSFSDLRSAINTIRTQDISEITSYITSNNVTKAWQERVDQFSYMIEDLERQQQAVEERIAALDQTIASYIKPKTVVMGLGSTNAEGSTSAYQISQHSEAYDALVQQRVELQTELSEIKEKITFYQERIAKMSGSSRDEDIAYVEAQLNGILAKVSDLLESIRVTAEEYYRTVGLLRAFQVVEAPDGGFSPFKLLRRSAADGVAVEAIIFGLFLLLAVIRGSKQPKQNRKAAKAAAQKA